MRYIVLIEITESEIQPEDTQEETPSVDRQTSKIVQIFSTHLDRILDPFL
jgi:hypothetical protein